jgi:squalene-hopene/tetraprenyl-beta-curcumene cyclase
LAVNRHLRKSIVLILAGATLALSMGESVRAAEGGVDPREVKAVVDKAVGFLGKRQAADGSFSGKVRGLGPGVSALVVASLLRNGVSPDDPLVAKTLAYLEGKVQKDGGIYDQALANYVTSVALMAFAEANTNGKYDTLLKKGTAFLKRLQYDDSRGDDKDPRYGGVGYDAKSKRPDMSNTYQFLEALQAAGVPRDDPAVQRAMKFISRCQNLPGETNDQPFARKTSDDDKGGLTYVPLDVDDNPHKTPNGGLRSLGGMTYAGLKSFLYAGVSKDDPRVKGAINWIRRHYTLEENPGMGQAGLYYYYHTFAKALNAWGEDQFEDAAGKKHDWRRELFEALKKRQRPDGSWVNEKDKQFAESNPDLATAFALLALSYCEAPKK